MPAVFGSRHAKKWLVQLFVFLLFQTGDDEHQTLKVFPQKVYGHPQKVFSLLQTGDDEHQTVKVFPQNVYGHQQNVFSLLQIGDDEH